MVSLGMDNRLLVMLG